MRAASYPDGLARLVWPGITHVRIRPRWLRFSDFNQRPPLIVEGVVTDQAELAGSAG